MESLKDQKPIMASSNVSIAAKSLTRNSHLELIWEHAKCIQTKFIMIFVELIKESACPISMQRILRRMFGMVDIIQLNLDRRYLINVLN